MHAVTEPIDNDAPAEATLDSKPQVRTLLLTDLCDSTLLVEKLGDAAAAELFREHDRLVLGLQQRWHGRLIDRSDGLLLLFERAIDGLGFALDYARGLRDIGERRKLARQGVELHARSGLHVGEVLTWRNSDAAVSFGAKPLEVEGLAKPMAGRLMTLARPGQILLSATAEPLAHRAARELGERGEQLVWKTWGRWRFKGVPQPQEVYEVGEPDIAPLRAPQQIRGKVWRDIPLWRRPAALAAELLLVAGLATGGWFLTRPQPAIAFGERDWVVVADLRNLTGDTLLDESLEQAFRISLEQSRYVNVLSDLKARDTLQRMRRSPDTALDRAIASEIALRDGARAVILPTVAEVGGRVRVSAEVIDPHTQTTVYAESADGSGAVSALASIDEVTSALRARLGEAIQSIERNSISLPNVTTRNLDALKAYALGMHERSDGDLSRALSYFERAASLDPDFALAYLASGGAKEALGDLAGGRAYYERAASLRKRLPPRESLLLDVSLVARSAPARAVARWKDLVGLYPDMHEAQFQLGLGELLYGNLHEDALRHAQLAAATQSSFVGRARYLEGMTLLGLERHDDAIAAFQEARKRGFNGAGVLHAAAYAAKRDFDGMERLLSQRRSTGVDSAELEARRLRMFAAIDRGEWQVARNHAAQGLGVARRLASPIQVAEWRNRALAVDVLASAPGNAQLRKEVMVEIDKLRSEAETLDAAFPKMDAYLLLGGGYLAARADVAEGIGEVLDAVPASGLAEHPLLAEMRRVLEAEQLRLAGNPNGALELLQPLLERDASTIPVHSAAFRSAIAAGRTSLAASQAAWLKQHRGRAYMEHGVDWLPTPFNIADAAAAAGAD